MSIALLQTALLLPFEQMLNALLALDPSAAARLQRLDGSVLAVHASSPALDIFVAVRGDRVQLAAQHEGIVTSSLHGSAAELLRLLAQRKPIDSLRARGVEVRGDVAFVQELRSLLLSLNVDWEYHFAKVAGDIPTQTLATGLRDTSAFLRKTGARLRDDIDEYLHDETRLLPTAAELDAFYADVTALRLRTDRLQARVQLLLSVSE
jgi:ubiquinone biosynthesis protein UbiJ